MSWYGELERREALGEDTSPRVPIGNIAVLAAYINGPYNPTMDRAETEAMLSGTPYTVLPCNYWERKHGSAKV